MPLAKMNASALANRIVAVLGEQGVTRTAVQVLSFGQAILDAEESRERWEKLLHVAEKLPTADILRWIDEAQRSGNLDEALWRGFLAGHFGRPSANSTKPEKVNSAGRLLCGFGTQPMWTWERVSSDLSSLGAWLSNHGEDLKTLHFGNHRKYESNKPSAIFEVISSFVRWVEISGGTPRQAFEANGFASAEAKFDALYHAMKGIQQFGRTGRFDTLCLLGSMGLISVKPSSCYLKGSTGPLRGARKLFGRHPVNVLERLADETAKRLEVAIEVFEDALCNWQKVDDTKYPGI